VGSAYELADKPWLEFRIDKPANAILVRSSGIVPDDVAADPDALWTYAFDFELVGEQEEILKQGRYFNRTRLSRFRDPHTGVEQPRSFVLDSGLLPTDSRSMLMELEFQTAAQILRLRPARVEETLETVAFRVYQHLPNAPHRLGYLWQRLGPPQKERLARGSVYGPDLLRSEEKTNLLRHTWKAVGPNGVNGEHYQSRKIYVAQESVGERVATGLLPDGLYVDADTRGIIPLPQGQWKLGLDLRPLQLHHSGNTSEVVTLRWFGQGLEKRWEGQIPVQTGEQQLPAHFDGGLLEVVSARPLVVRGWAESDTNRLEVTPEPTRLPSYMINRAQSLAFGIDHVGNQPTPFRVDVRARIPGDVASHSAKIEYVLLADGEPLEKGSLDVELSVSTYDRTAQSDTETRLSDSEQLYFRLPPSVSSIRLSSTQDVLITAYSRPPDLTRRVRVPEDYQAFQQDQSRQPPWFLLQPLEVEQLRRELRVVGLLTQKRPPQTDPMLMAGVYAWEGYRPEGNWRGRFLMLPYESAFPVRDQALGSVYRELPRNRTISLRLSGGMGRHEVNPTLVFVRRDHGPTDIEFIVDGAPHLRTKIAGTQGEVRLPPLQIGSRQVHVRTSAPARFYLNHAGASGASFLRRLAIKLDSQGLDFSYRKASPGSEILTAEFYSESASHTRLQVSIEQTDTIHALAKRDWTFAERVYDLQPATPTEVTVLNTRGQSVDGGRKFWIPLGADLPANSYRIRIRPTAAGRGYLVLYRLLPGQQMTRLFFRERPYAE
jgi:hypothetical protein